MHPVYNTDLDRPFPRSKWLQNIIVDMTAQYPIPTNPPRDTIQPNGQQKPPTHQNLSSPKTLILCLDGTQNQFGPLPSSNALKFFGFLDKDSQNQLCYYQPGVGVTFSSVVDRGYSLDMSANIIQRELDSVFAFSFPVHVKAAYTFLVRFYNKGDKICLVGFSRGSFAARILVGMLESVGLLNKGLESMVSTAWTIYSDWEYAGQPKYHEDYSGCLISEFRKTFCRSEVSVHFLGLFDTVNSIGLVSDRMFPFTSRSNIVEHVRHAISLDENRSKFKQVLFQPYSYYPHMTDLDYEECDEDPVPDILEATTPVSYIWDWFRSLFRTSINKRRDECNCQDVKEVVFPGNHGDVGGGWSDTATNQRLSNIPLRWMISQAFKHGIIFKPDKILEFNSEFPLVPSLLAYDHNMLQFKGNHEEDIDRSVLPSEAIPGSNRSGGTSYFETIMWWLVEILPVGTKIEDKNGHWKNVYVPNLGRPRKLPSQIHYHWSVFYRLHYIRDYSPKNLPDNFGDRFYDLMSHFTKYNQQEIQEYATELTVEKVKQDKTSEFWKSIPDELEQVIESYSNAL